MSFKMGIASKTVRQDSSCVSAAALPTFESFCAGLIGQMCFPKALSHWEHVSRGWPPTRGCPGHSTHTRTGQNNQRWGQCEWESGESTVFAPRGQIKHPGGPWGREVAWKTFSEGLGYLHSRRLGSVWVCVRACVYKGGGETRLCTFRDKKQHC